MSTDDRRTDVDAAAELSAQPVYTRLDAGEVVSAAVPPDWTRETIDLERYADTPRRSAGTVRVHDSAGFVAAVQKRAPGVEELTLYADEETTALVAVLNDDTSVTPGWRDYRVELSLRKRPEWVHWRSLDGHLVSQERFAAHVEDGLEELVRPGAAEMLDLAQTFHATTAARFKGGHRLASGARQFVYEEDVDASAGPGGEVAIPETFELAVRPFFGSDRFAVDARFRFTLKAGDLSLGYKLNRPDDVERAAFLAVVTAVGAELDLPPIAGAAPAAR